MSDKEMLIGIIVAVLTGAIIATKRKKSLLRIYVISSALGISALLWNYLISPSPEAYVYGLAGVIFPICHLVSKFGYRGED